MIETTQKDKDGNLIYLYATNLNEQYSYIKAAQDKGYSVLLFDGQLDVPCIQTLEQKFEKSRFTRVDADTVDHLIQKDDAPKCTLADNERDNLTAVFQSQMPKLEKAEFLVEVNSLGEEQRPVVITQNEWMRRMKEMSRYQSGMSFYGQMPDSFNLVLNSDHRLIKEVLNEAQSALSADLNPIESELKGQEARMAALNQKTEKKKPEEITQEEKDDKTKTQSTIDDLKKKKEQLISDYAQKNTIVHQLIDLALLQNGMLKGESLDKFLKRSFDLIK
jgi:molecular chaperone HtpG